MAIRALPALLLILFLPHPLEASEAGDIDYSGIEVSESLAIHLAAEAHRKALGLAQFRYDRATAKKITRVEWPDGYYDLPPGDDGGYTKFHTAYWDVTFWGIKENMVGFHGGGALVNIRTGEVEIMGGVIEHFKSNELRDGQGQVIPEGGERGFPIVKKWNETCAMVCSFDKARYEAAQRAFDKAKAVIESVMGVDCCNPAGIFLRR